jgi:hypothetical protein
MTKLSQISAGPFSASVPTGEDAPTADKIELKFRKDDHMSVESVVLSATNTNGNETNSANGNGMNGH